MWRHFGDNITYSYYLEFLLGNHLLQEVNVNKYNANEALNEIMALKRKLQQEMDKNKKLEKDLEQKELDIDILKKASAILMKK